LRIKEQETRLILHKHDDDDDDDKYENILSKIKLWIKMAFVHIKGFFEKPREYSENIESKL
jgi:hypothetical protein